MLGRDQLPTMRDVANRSGVSLKTVSRVVNGEAGVRPETAQRVHAAITALGFQRNEIARSLRPGQRSATLGLVIEDLSNPFYSMVARAVEDVAQAHRFMVMICSSEEDPERERKLIGTLLERRVDGLLVVPARGDHAHRAIDPRRPIPTVFIDRPPGNLVADTVLVDNRGGTRRAVSQMLELGHRRVGFVGDTVTIYTARERFESYRQTLWEAGVPFDPELMAEARTVVEAADAVRRLLHLPDPPTALFAGNNLITTGALQALRGWGTPIALIGFDDFQFADVLGVTVVAYDPAAIGRQAANLLFARLAEDQSWPRQIVLPTWLIQRGSGEIQPPSP